MGWEHDKEMVTKNIIYLFTMKHCLACVFIFIGYWSCKQYDGTCWLANSNVDLDIDNLDSDPWNAYVIAMSFEIITLSTVGYGDIIPTNTIDRVFILFNILLGCAYFAFIVTKIFGTLHWMFELREKRRTTEKALAEHLY